MSTNETSAIKKVIVARWEEEMQNLQAKFDESKRRIVEKTIEMKIIVHSGVGTKDEFDAIDSHIQAMKAEEDFFAKQIERLNKLIEAAKEVK